MLSNELGKALSDLGSAEQERDALLESIKEPMALVRARRERAITDIEAALLDAMSDRGMEVLVDPESAAEVYSIGWMNGLGLQNFEQMLDMVVDHPSVQFSLADWSGEETWNSAGMVKQVAVRFQRGGDPALVDSAIAILGPILAAQWAINPGARLEVRTDVARWGDVTISQGDNGGLLLLERREILHRGTLDELVRLVAQRYPHGATPEYQSTHRGDAYQPPVHDDDDRW